MLNFSFKMDKALKVMDYYIILLQILLINKLYLL
ncbi:hypothetical protein HDC91_000675 [Mucilaginibacter sp. AK015]|nr:hypothetical protein [Mucilaginibacter sp. AK015]